MTKGVKISLAVLAVILMGAVVCAAIMNRPAESTWVSILQDGEEIYRLDLANEPDREIRIDYPGGGYNIVTISGGSISITEADCADHTCIRTGALRGESVPIVCLPHKLIVRYSDSEAGE